VQWLRAELDLRVKFWKSLNEQAPRSFPMGIKQSVLEVHHSPALNAEGLRMHGILLHATCILRYYRCLDTDDFKIYI
jgi:hypothetical protein